MDKTKTIEKDISDLAGIFTDPIISFPSSWNQDIPQWVKNQITFERLIMEMKGHKGEEKTGTDAEALAYIMPASLEFPLRSEWTRIYLYVSTKVCKSAGKQVPEDIRVESLDDYHMSELNRLKAWIYQKRTQARQEHDRAERREQREKEMAERKALQPALFDF